MTKQRLRKRRKEAPCKGVTESRVVGADEGSGLVHVGAQLEGLAQGDGGGGRGRGEVVLMVMFFFLFFFMYLYHPLIFLLQYEAAYIAHLRSRVLLTCVLIN